jgi:hypothetical protein
VIQSRQHSSFAHELFARLLDQLWRQAAVVLDFFEGAKAPLQAQVISQVDAPHPSLTDDPADPVSIPQYFAWF